MSPEALALGAFGVIGALVLLVAGALLHKHAQASHPAAALVTQLQQMVLLLIQQHTATEFAKQDLPAARTLVTGIAQQIANGLPPALSAAPPMPSNPDEARTEPEADESIGFQVPNTLSHEEALEQVLSGLH